MPPSFLLRKEKGMLENVTLSITPEGSATSHTVRDPETVALLLSALSEEQLQKHFTSNEIIELKGMCENYKARQPKRPSLSYKYVEGEDLKEWLLSLKDSKE